MAFLKTKGLRPISCFESSSFTDGSIKGDVMILWYGVLGESWRLIVFDPLLSLEISFTEGQKKLWKNLHSLV
jgi:hypothetical protein